MKTWYSFGTHERSGDQRETKRRRALVLIYVCVGRGSKEADAAPESLRRRPAALGQRTLSKAVCRHSPPSGMIMRKVTSDDPLALHTRAPITARARGRERAESERLRERSQHQQEKEGVEPL